MRLVMTLMVRNEEDVLGANIEHHLGEGVDHVLVTDHRSEDESRSIAAEYERAGVVTLLDETRDVWDQGPWVTRMARMAATDFEADWVINNDADEFWFPPEGTLKEHLADLPAEVTVVDAPRHDLLLVEDARPWHERMVYRYADPLRSDGTYLPSKVCHRADPEVVVAPGNHGAEGPRLGAPVETGIHIVHAQLRCAEQRRRKVVLTVDGYERNEQVGPQIGHHVRAVAERVHNDEYEAWWQEQRVDLDGLKQLVLAGEVVVDHRVRDVVRQVDGGVHGTGSGSGRTSR